MEKILIYAIRGKIINIASIAGKEPSPLIGMYSCSKAAVIALTKVLAKELAPRITVNAVCPGLVDTEMVRGTIALEDIKKFERSFPISRMGTPSEVADLVLFLASDKSSYITGAAINISGGDLLV